MPNGNIAPVDVLPPDDGSIERGLAELNEGLEAWLAAFRQALAMLPGGSAAPIAAAALAEAVASQKKSQPPRAKPSDRAFVERPQSQIGESEVTPAPQRDNGAAEFRIIEDEALLAALAPEVRKQVHIRRRMSNHRKSVRELIDEVQPAMPAAEIPKTKSNTRRKWW